MAEQVDVYKLIVEVEGAQTIGQLEEGLKTLRDELKNKDIGSKEFKDLKKAISDTELQLEAATDKGKTFGSTFSNATGGILSGFQAATGAMAVFTNGSEQSIEAMARLQGIMQLKEGVAGIKNSIVQMTGLQGMIAKGIKGFNGLKIAMASLGIGVIVLAVTSLVAAFTRFDSLTDKLEVGIAAIKGGFDALLDTIALLGSALIKLFSGDFRGAAKDASNAISGFNERIKEGVVVAMEAAKAAQQLKDTEIGLILNQAKLRKSIAENREIISDETSTIGEKIKAIDEAKKASETYYNNELRLARMRLRVLDLETKTNVELTREQRKAIEEAKANILQLEEAQAREQKTLNRDQKRVNNEKAQLAKEAFESRKKQIEDEIKYELERLTLLGQLTFEKEKEFLDRKLKARIINQKEYDNALLKLQIDYQKQTQKQEEDLIRSQEENAKLILQLEKEQFEEGVKNINDSFKKIQLGLLQSLMEGNITRKQYEDMLLVEQEQALKDEVALREMYGHDATDLQIKLAELEIKIQKDKNDTIIENDKAMLEARVAIANNAADILGNIGDILNDEQNQQNALAKAAALVRIGIDTAQAISALVKNSEQNPANSVTFGLAGIAQFTAGIARITANISQAKRLLGGGGSSPSFSNNNAYSTPIINNQPQTVRAITSSQTIKAAVLIKDINGAQQKIDVIDGNSFVIK